MKHKYKIFGFLILFLIFAFLFLIWWSREDTKAGLLDDFAKCLADRNLVMYGAEWCSHCQNQKKMFARSFRYVNYVECPQDPARCLAAGIEGYPTWITANGEKLVGEQKLETLSQISNCALPISNY